ncbi:group 1 truncated hemoglobin [Blastococcus sp. SYSU D00669]
MADGRLFEAIGGAPALSVAVTILYDRMLADPVLAPWFDGVDLTRLREHQRDFLTVALDGPPVVGSLQRYQGRAVARAHAGLGVDDGSFDRMRDHLVATLRELGVEPALLDEVRARVEAQRAAVVGPA